MKYGRFLSALALLSAVAVDSGAGMQAGYQGAGGAGFVEVHGGGRHLGKGGHFHGGQRHHFGGRHHHHHHKHGGAAVIIGVPLFWSGYQAVQPYHPPQPQAYISQSDVNPVWYYCDNPRGYYPYVTACPAGWRAVDTATLPQW